MNSSLRCVINAGSRLDYDDGFRHSITELPDYDDLMGLVRKDKL